LSLTSCPGIYRLFMPESRVSYRISGLRGAILPVSLNMIIHEHLFQGTRVKAKPLIIQVVGGYCDSPFALPHAISSRTTRHVAFRDAEADYNESSSQPEVECIICTLPYPSSSFPTRPPTKQCQHMATICTGCLALYIAAEVSSKGVGSVGAITCPQLECGLRMEFEDIVEAAERDVFER